jgi:hypothetical protein
MYFFSTWVLQAGSDYIKVTEDRVARLFLKWAIDWLSRVYINIHTRTKYSNKIGTNRIIHDMQTFNFWMAKCKGYCNSTRKPCSKYPSNKFRRGLSRLQCSKFCAASWQSTPRQASSKPELSIAVCALTQHTSTCDLHRSQQNMTNLRHTIDQKNWEIWTGRTESKGKNEQGRRDASLFNHHRWEATSGNGRLVRAQLRWPSPVLRLPGRTSGRRKCSKISPLCIWSLFGASLDHRAPMPPVRSSREQYVERRHERAHTRWDREEITSIWPLRFPSAAILVTSAGPCCRRLSSSPHRWFCESPPPFWPTRRWEGRCGAPGERGNNDDCLCRAAPGHGRMVEATAERRAVTTWCPLFRTIAVATGKSCVRASW